MSFNLTLIFCFFNSLTRKAITCSILMGFLNNRNRIMSICWCRCNIYYLILNNHKNPYLSKQYIFKTHEKIWLSVKYIVNSRRRLAYFWHFSHENFHGKSFSRVCILYSLSYFSYCYFTWIENSTTWFFFTHWHF